MAYFHLKFGMDIVFVEAKMIAVSDFQKKKIWTIDEVIDPKNSPKMENLNVRNFPGIWE